MIFRFYSGKYGNVIVGILSFYILLKQENSKTDSWIVVHSTHRNVPEGSHQVDIVTIEKWNRSPNSFAMEFEAATLEEAKEKIFIHLL